MLSPQADWAYGTSFTQCSSPKWPFPNTMVPTSSPSGSIKEQSRKKTRGEKQHVAAEGTPSPRKLPASEVPVQSTQDSWTTVMLRNLPNDYTREMLLALLDTQGFANSYDFVYMPIDFKKRPIKLELAPLALPDRTDFSNDAFASA